MTDAVPASTARARAFRARGRCASCGRVTGPAYYCVPCQRRRSGYRPALCLGRYRCSRCDELGHNIRTCDKVLIPRFLAESACEKQDRGETGRVDT